MAGVSIQFAPTAFSAGGPLYRFADNKQQARWTIAGLSDEKQSVAGNTSRRDYGLSLNPDKALVILYGSPTWFETVDEFNRLAYNEMRSAIANAVEQGVLQVLDSGGGVATVTAIRAGTVA
jgi:hypothetical protein